MHALLHTRPAGFGSVEEGIEWQSVSRVIVGVQGQTLFMIQRQDECHTERHVSADIDPGDPGPLYFK